MTKSGIHLTLASDTVEQDRVILTPKLAEKWVGTQTRNRLLNRRIVAAYARDMSNGDWTYTGDPIRFDITGSLIDGQHRLTALSQQDESLALEFLVVRGLPTEAQMMMDQGAKRTTGQQMSMVGYKNSNALAAGIRTVLFWEAGKIADRAWDEGLIANTALILEWANAHPDEVEMVNQNFNAIRQIGIRPGVGCAFVLKAGYQYSDLVREFFSDMYEMIGLPKGSPLIAFRKRLDRSRAEGIKLTDVDQLGFLILTWNHWINNGTITKLQRPHGAEWTSENFPVMEV